MKNQRQWITPSKQNFQVWVDGEPMPIWFGSFGDACNSADHLHRCKPYAASLIEVWAVSHDGTSQRGVEPPPYKIMGGGGGQ